MVRPHPLHPLSLPFDLESNKQQCDWCANRRRRAAPREAAAPRPQAQVTTKGRQAWASWMRAQNSIGELRARERTWPREGLRCLAARS
ncbi:hypothetical protein IMZ48_42335 [Candidatus Bathyarchaeota archaeon]|nr:hypothetical protein [Candidatus Bathyarchaeota archaeon]